MSDFLLPTQKNDFWNQYENKNNNVQNQNTQTDYWQNQSQKTMEQKQAQLDNRERYGVNVPDEYYEVFNKIISQAATPEEAQAEAYKIGSAVKYSQMMSIPLEEAYKNVDALNEAQFPDKLDQKGRFEALADMWTLGKNNVKLGELGQKLMRANAENDTELSQSLMAEIDALNQQNQLMQDNAPRSWVMQALEAGAQSLPFTAAVAGAGIVGNFIAPAAGTGASFAASSYLSAGTEYIDMLANGASPETARAVAMVSGGIQGLIEADLGITKGIVKGAARVAGKEVAENTAKKGLEEIGRKVFKRFHFGAGKKVLINYLENRGKDILGEGTEEFLQEITSIVGQEVAASLEGYDIPDDDFKSIVKQTTEAFRGGVLGALSMGFIPAGLNAAADVSSFKAIKDGAEVIESEEVFKEAVKDNPVFEGMSEQQKAETIHDVWQNAQNRKEEAANLEAQKIAEGRDAAEGAEEAPEENEDGTTEAQAVARNDAGRLYTSDDVSTDDEGNVTGGTFVIGDKTKSENNRYGYITYKTDEDGNITIENFKMTAEREGLRNEAFDEFAREHPDVNIEWNAIGSEAQGFKDALIEANPSGKNNGLNYYTTNELDNIAARKMVAEEVRRNIHNVKQNADGSYSRTELNNKQVAAAVTLIESAARRQNMGLAEYVSKTFGNQIFGSREEFAEATLAQGENVATKAGGMSQGVAQANWREVGQMVKAVIYAGENADFSTWAHEMAHVFQAQLDGDLKSEAEAAFNVVGGDWTRSTYTFSDGRTMSSAEAFAYGFQDWLETGKAESEQMKNIFQKFAEFIADAYNRLRKHLDFSPEIENVFNKLLDGDDTIMSKALKAAEAEEKEYRAKLKRDAEEKEAQKKAAAEEAQRQAEAEREEESETTEYAENAPTAEELINGIEEVENEKEPETDAIDNALKDLPLTDEKKTEIADVLKDENTTRVEKAEAVTEAAESVYAIPDDMFFQIVGEIGAQNLDDSEVQEGVTRMQNLVTAKEMEKEGKDAKTIRTATAWERGSDGKWKYEIDDSKVNFDSFGMIDFNKSHPRLNELTQKLIDGKTLTDSEQKEYDELNAEYGKVYDEQNNSEAVNYFGKKLELSKILDNEELFKAYPKLKNIIVEFKPQAKDGTAGSYNELDNRITLYVNSKDEWLNQDNLKSVLLHEVQHAIQRIEGFAKGGNVEQFKPRIRTKDEVINKDLQWAESLEDSYPDKKAEMQEIKSLMLDGNRNQAWEKIHALQKEAIEKDDRDYARYIDEYGYKLDKIQRNIITEDIESPEQQYRRLAGETEARNVQIRINFTPEERRNTLLAATEDVAPEDKIILFQQVYHGSPHNFENFSTENIGTGEGAQAFGWGLYFTNQEGIARFYADKLANEPARISLISKNEYLKSRKKSLRDVENKEKYEARIIKNINHFKKELKQAQKAGDESEIKFYEGLIDDSIKQLDEKERLSYVEAFKKDIANAEKEIKELKASMKNNRNLYTVDIPDEGYLVWDKHVSPENIEGIKAALKDRGITDFTRIDNLVENQEKWKDNPNATYTLGGNFYKVISDYLGGDKEASLFLKDLGYIGIDYPANSFTGYTSEGERNYVIFDEKNANIKKHLLYQNVYHGSGADFDKFDTKNFGFSGEGSMSFGYGTYLTDNEDIAKDYANRQRKTEITLNGKEWLPDESKLHEKIIYGNLKNGWTIEDAIKWAEGIKLPDRQSLVLDTLKELQEKGLKVVHDKRKVYTVEIPDDGYLGWKEKVTQEQLDHLADVYAEEFYNRWMLDPNAQEDIARFTQQQKDDMLQYFKNKIIDKLKYHEDFNGRDLYYHLSEDFKYYTNGNSRLAQREASELLYKAGYAGIKYPAGTIHGNGNGAYNYVIFNDEDAQIVDKLLFQTQAELMDVARQFANWQEFMAYCEESNDEGNVFESDEAWYRSFWEQANGIAQEEEKKAEAEERQQQAEADTPEMVDRLFISYIKNNPETVDNFVQQVSDIMEMDLGGDEWAQVDEEGGRERERYAVLQDYISAELRDGNWQTAIAKVQGGHEITDYIRKRLITEMTDSYKARDFRSLYAAVMKEKRFTVDALDTRADELLRKLEKYPKRYYDIVSPTEDVTITTPQRRKEIAQEMQNRDMAARIKAGSLKLDDEVYNYLKSVEKKEKDLKKQEQQLTEKIQGLYSDVGNTGLQMLVNTHEKLMEQKARLNNRNADVQRKIDKGLRMTDRYTRQTQDMTQTYHELERKFSDLKDSMIITNEVQQILDAQEQRREIREEVARLAKERYLADETKKIRVNLVKQLFRKVDLSKVDFKQAQQIIAIQKLTMPNMIGGVNRWIGRNSPFLNAVLSRIVTDSEYKERIVNYLEHVEKQTDTFRDFVESIRSAKSREDFENWGVAEREYAIKYLPKENWVWELKLKEKARELQESLHLDITQEKVERQVYDADGHPVEDDEGNPVMETAYQFKISDETLNKLLHETLGEELFNRLMNSPMVEWSTQEMEELVARVNQLRDEGITMRAAKLEARKREAQKFMQQIGQAVKDTGITINEDDTPEEKEKKLEKINKILGKNKNLKGTEASKDTGFTARLNRILHGYKDANVLRVSRILDNQSEGVNTYLLYRREDDCYNAKMRSIVNRGETVHKVMAANKINEGELAKSVTIDALGTKFTVDELLFFLAADKDFQLDENGNNDNYAATSRNAVCYGNMMSDTASQELKESWAKLDADMKKAIEKDLLTPEQRQLLSDKQLDTRPGTTAYIRECNRRWDIVIQAANDYLSTHPEYNALLEAIQADYADQYERMNEVSINEFNVGVNRVKCYVPLVRREQNGETNENQVMEDLLAINGVGKSGVNKGMTQSRQTISPLHQRPVQTGLFRTWCDSVERTEHFIAYAPYVRLLNRVYNSRDAQYLRSDIEGRYGKGMLDYIDAYISEVANPNAQNTRSTGAELLHILRGKTAPAYLGWKASAIIKQGLTSPWPYMQFVNPAEYLAACFKCNNPKMWEAIQEKSVFMKNRRMDPINDLVDEIAKNAKNKADKFWSSFTKTGMQGLEWIDWVCVAPGWYACYEKKYNQLQKASEARYNAKMAELEERNKSGNGEVLNPTQMETIARQEMLEDIEMEAITYADDCTRACQPSNRLTDLAPMFKDKNEFMRAFLQFQTSLNVIWQNIRYDMPYAVKQKEFGRIVGTVLGYTMAGIFMNSVMDGITNGADDDDDKDKQALRNLVFYATTQFTDAIPMLGSDFTNIMDQVITGKRGFMNSGTDMTPTASKLFSAFTSAGKGDWQKAASLTAEAIGLFMGAPVSGVKEINKLLGKPLDNGDVNLARGISDVYGIAGDILEE